jgi:hypothetical protein
MAAAFAMASARPAPAVAENIQKNMLENIFETARPESTRERSEPSNFFWSFFAGNESQHPGLFIDSEVVGVTLCCVVARWRASNQTEW